MHGTDYTCNQHNTERLNGSNTLTSAFNLEWWIKWFFPSVLHVILYTFLYVSFHGGVFALYKALWSFLVFSLTDIIDCLSYKRNGVFINNAYFTITEFTKTIVFVNVLLIYRSKRAVNGPWRTRSYFKTVKNRKKEWILNLNILEIYKSIRHCLKSYILFC